MFKLKKRQNLVKTHFLVMFRGKWPWIYNVNQAYAVSEK